MHTDLPSENAAIARQLFGTWRLVSWTQRFADGTTRQHPRSVAYLIYSDASRMCFISMHPHRPQRPPGAPLTVDAAVAEMGDQAFGAYCSTVEVHATEGFVLHHVEIDARPAMVGRTRKRWFTFDGPNRLSLRIDPSEHIAPVIESTLTFERVE